MPSEKWDGEGACGLTLKLKLWNSGHSVYCEEEDIGVTSYPRLNRYDAINRFCYRCRNNPGVRLSTQTANKEVAE